MKKILTLAHQLNQAKMLPWLVIPFTLGILGCTIYFGMLELRRTIGRQIINRDAEVLDAVTVLDQLGADSPAELSRQLDDASGQMALALRLSRLRQGVLAVRLFAPSGHLVAAMPASVKASTLAPPELACLRRLQPLSRYDPAGRLEDYFLLPPTAESSPATRLPLLSVFIPIHPEGHTNLLAVAELIQEGTAITRELRILDENLVQQAYLAFAVSGGIVLVALTWAFHRLQRLTDQLHDHAASLRRANQELALSAKTSALGAITAHVLHGLTSPLTGLQNFAAAHAPGNGDWQAVLQNTRQMQNLVGELVRLLGEQTDGTSYELPLEELAHILASRAQAAAQAAGVTFESRLSAHGALSNRTANLVLLILENLLQNAIQATPPGKCVRLSMALNHAGLVCEVADQGAGLPDSLRDGLFVPCRSTKAAGNGLGLALSRHLARHLGADLTLVRSSADGSVFSLILPKPALQSSAHQPNEQLLTPA